MIPVKAVFILPNLLGGGAERVVLTLLRHFDYRVIQPTLILLKKTGVYWDELPSNLPVMAISEDGERIRKGFWKFWKQARPILSNSDLIIGAEELDATYYAYCFGKIFKKPTIGWVHSPIEDYLKQVPDIHQKLVRLIYPRLHTIVFPSPGAAQSMSNLFIRKDIPQKVIANPIDLEAVRIKAAEPIPEEYHSIFTKPVVMAMGRLSYEKGFDQLIRAHSIARQSGKDYHLLILGEGENRQKLEAIVSELKLEDSVFMPGFVPNPYPMLAGSTIFVHPARYEGFGMVVLEALTVGVPVIAMKSSGVTGILCDGKYGIEIPQGGVEILAEKIVHLLGHREERNKMVENGYTRAECYKVGKVIQLWEDLLKSSSSSGRETRTDLG